MSRTKNLIIGVVLLTFVAWVMTLLLGALAKPRESTQAAAPTAVPAQELLVYGGYRFDHERILTYLRDTYGLAPTFQKVGTFDMADDWSAEVDCIFPSSRTGIEYFEQARPGVIRQSETIFIDLIVVFTWEEYLPSLEQAGIVNTVDGVHYLYMPPLLEAMEQNQQWQELGVEIPGYVNVESTDPIKSASGLMWVSLMGTYLVAGNESGGHTVTLDDINTSPQIVDFLYQYWEYQGQQVDTTGKLFPKFIRSGAGLPMIVAYESNYTDWVQSLPEEQKAQAEKIIGLYPAEFTISTEHTLASTSAKCDPLLDAFAHDPVLQQLAWELAGVRNGAGDIGGRPGSASWIAPTVPFIPEPKQEATDAIKEALQ